MSTVDLDAIRKRVDAATPGPWGAVASGEDGFPECAVGVWVGDPEEAFIFEDQDTLLSDAEFIAHAREDVPALLAEVERLRAELAEERTLHTRTLTALAELVRLKNGPRDVAYLLGKGSAWATARQALAAASTRGDSKP